MGFYCIADEDTVRGLRLSGVPGETATGASQAAAALARAATRDDCAIILLGEDAAAVIRAQVDAFRLERDRPLILEIPGPGGPRPGRRELQRLAQEAVGWDVNKAGA
jgi:V/A-type H+-transporting ATPase subunit F